MSVDALGLGSNIQVALLALQQAAAQQQAVVALVAQATQAQGNVGSGSPHLGQVLDTFV
jgi:hypothetical protein